MFSSDFGQPSPLIDEANGDSEFSPQRRVRISSTSSSLGAVSSMAPSVASTAVFLASPPPEEQLVLTSFTAFAPSSIAPQVTADEAEARPPHTSSPPPPSFLNDYVNEYKGGGGRGFASRSRPFAAHQSHANPNPPLSSSSSFPASPFNPLSLNGPAIIDATANTDDHHLSGDDGGGGDGGGVISSARASPPPPPFPSSSSSSSTSSFVNDLLKAYEQLPSDFGLMGNRPAAGHPPHSSWAGVSGNDSDTNNKLTTAPPPPLSLLDHLRAEQGKIRAMFDTLNAKRHNNLPSSHPNNHNTIGQESSSSRADVGRGGGGGPRGAADDIIANTIRAYKQSFEETRVRHEKEMEALHRRFFSSAAGDGNAHRQKKSRALSDAASSPPSPSATPFVSRQVSFSNVDSHKNNILDKSNDRNIDADDNDVLAFSVKAEEEETVSAESTTAPQNASKKLIRPKSVIGGGGGNDHEHGNDDGESQTDRFSEQGLRGREWARLLQQQISPSTKEKEATLSFPPSTTNLKSFEHNRNRITAMLDRLCWSFAVNEGLRQQLKEKVDAQKKRRATATLKQHDAAKPSGEDIATKAIIKAIFNTNSAGNNNSHQRDGETSLAPPPPPSSVADCLAQLRLIIESGTSSSAAAASAFSQLTAGGKEVEARPPQQRPPPQQQQRWLPDEQHTTRSAAAKLLLTAKGALSTSSATPNPSFRPLFNAIHFGFPLLKRQEDVERNEREGPTRSLSLLPPTGDATIDALSRRLGECLREQKDDDPCQHQHTHHGIVISPAEEDELRELLGNNAIDFLLFGPEAVLLKNNDDSDGDDGNEGADDRKTYGELLFSHKSSGKALHTKGNKATTTSQGGGVHSLQNFVASARRRDRKGIALMLKQHIGDVIRWKMNKTAMIKGKIECEKDGNSSSVTTAAPLSDVSPTAPLFLPFDSLLLPPPSTGFLKGVSSTVAITSTSTDEHKSIRQNNNGSVALPFNKKGVESREDGGNDDSSSHDGTTTSRRRDVAVNTVASVTAGIKFFAPKCEEDLDFAVDDEDACGEGWGWIRRAEALAVADKRRRREQRQRLKREAAERRRGGGETPNTRRNDGEADADQNAKEDDDENDDDEETFFAKKQKRRRVFTDLAPLINNIFTTSGMPIGPQEARRQKHCAQIANRGSTCFVLPFPIATDEGNRCAFDEKGKFKRELINKKVQREEEMAAKKKKGAPLLGGGRRSGSSRSKASQADEKQRCRKMTRKLERILRKSNHESRNSKSNEGDDDDRRLVDSLMFLYSGDSVEALHAFLGKRRDFTMLTWGGVSDVEGRVITATAAIAAAGGDDAAEDSDDGGTNGGVKHKKKKGTRSGTTTSDAEALLQFVVASSSSMIASFSKPAFVKHGKFSHLLSSSSLSTLFGLPPLISIKALQYLARNNYVQLSNVISSKRSKKGLAAHISDIAAADHDDHRNDKDGDDDDNTGNHIVPTLYAGFLSLGIETDPEGLYNAIMASDNFFGDDDVEEGDDEDAQQSYAAMVMGTRKGGHHRHHQNHNQRSGGNHHHNNTSPSSSASAPSSREERAVLALLRRLTIRREPPLSGRAILIGDYVWDNPSPLSSPSTTDDESDGSSLFTSSEESDVSASGSSSERSSTSSTTSSSLSSSSSSSDDSLGNAYNKAEDVDGGQKRSGGGMELFNSAMPFMFDDNDGGRRRRTRTKGNVDGRRKGLLLMRGGSESFIVTPFIRGGSENATGTQRLASTRRSRMEEEEETRREDKRTRRRSKKGNEKEKRSEAQRLYAERSEQRALVASEDFEIKKRFLYRHGYCDTLAFAAAAVAFAPTAANNKVNKDMSRQQQRREVDGNEPRPTSEEEESGGRRRLAPLSPPLTAAATTATPSSVNNRGALDYSFSSFSIPEAMMASSVFRQVNVRALYQSEVAATVAGSSTAGGAALTDAATAVSKLVPKFRAPNLLPLLLSSLCGIRRKYFLDSAPEIVKKKKTSSSSPSVSLSSRLAATILESYHRYYESRANFYGMLRRSTSGNSSAVGDQSMSYQHDHQNGLALIDSRRLVKGMRAPSEITSIGPLSSVEGREDYTAMTLMGILQLQFANAPLSSPPSHHRQLVKALRGRRCGGGAAGSRFIGTNDSFGYPTTTTAATNGTSRLHAIAAPTASPSPSSSSPSVSPPPLSLSNNAATMNPHRQQQQRMMSSCLLSASLGFSGGGEGGGGGGGGGLPQRNPLDRTGVTHAFNGHPYRTSADNDGSNSSNTASNTNAADGGGGQQHPPPRHHGVTRGSISVGPDFITVRVAGTHKQQVASSASASPPPSNSAASRHHNSNSSSNNHSLQHDASSSSMPPPSIFQDESIMAPTSRSKRGSAIPAAGAANLFAGNNNNNNAANGGGGGDNNNSSASLLKIPIANIVEVVLGSHGVGFLPSIEEATLMARLKKAEDKVMRRRRRREEARRRVLSSVALGRRGGGLTGVGGVENGGGDDDDEGRKTFVTRADYATVSPFGMRAKHRRAQLARHYNDNKASSAAESEESSADGNDSSAATATGSSDDDERSHSRSRHSDTNTTRNGHIITDVDEEAMFKDGGRHACDSLAGLKDRYYQSMTLVYAPEAAEQRAQIARLFDPSALSGSGNGSSSTSSHFQHFYQHLQQNTNNNANRRRNAANHAVPESDLTLHDLNALYDEDTAGEASLDSIPLREAYVSVVIDSPSEWNAIVTALMTTAATSSSFSSQHRHRLIPIRFAAPLPVELIVKRAARQIASHFVISSPASVATPPSEERGGGGGGEEASHPQSLSAPPPTIAPLSPRELALLATAENSLKALEGLSPDELTFCERFHLLPLVYVNIKRIILSRYARPLKHFDSVTQHIDIDFFRLQMAVRFFEEKGWVRLHTVLKPTSAKN